MSQIDDATAEQQRLNGIMNFWRDVEMFNVNTVDNTKAEKDDKGRPTVVRHSLSYGDSLPWDPKSKAYVPDTDEHMWFHLVFGGTAERSAYVEAILEAMVGEPELTEREKEDFYGKCWTFAMMVTSEGRPFRESYIAANYAVATMLAQRGKSTDLLTEAMNNNQRKFLELHPDSGRTIHPKNATLPTGAPPVLTQTDPDDEDNDNAPETLRWTIGEHVFDWSHFDREMRLRDDVLTEEQIGDAADIMIISKRMDKPKLNPKTKQYYPQSMPEWNVMNSFYLEGLDRLLHNLDTVQNTALGGYLARPVPESQRMDLIADQKAMAMAASPSRMPLGRWPSNPKHPLSFGQQVAVAEIADTLSDGQGLVAVNGPPGTGKTTLLRDIMAHVTVSRAFSIAELKGPKDYFTKFVSETRDGTIAIPNPDCTKGFGIVVASANNAAVDNISREVPLEGSIDGDTFAGASYLPGLGQIVADPRGKYAIEKNKQMERAAPPAWGLTAAALGRRSNLSNFFNKVLAYTKGQDPSSIIVSLGDEVQNIRKRVRKTGRDWYKVRNEFLALAAAIRKSRASLEAEEFLIRAEQENEPRIWQYGREIEAINQKLDLLKARPDPAATAELRRQMRVAVEAREKLVWQSCQEPNTNVRKHVTVPDDAFFALGQDDRHRASLWAHHKMDEKRSHLFLLALELQELTISENIDKILPNMKIMRADMTGSSEGGMTRPGKRALWDTLFSIVPVVSTTLASLPRNFAMTGEGHIGWMLIDEAGQASPQIVAEALWRSQRAVVIGDPRQIEPVVTTPLKLIEAFRKMHGVAAEYSPASSSAQVVADQTMSRGSIIKVGDEKPVWTGIPLRAHRRCVEPMFSIANKIAYGGQMVQSTPESRMTQPPLGYSAWLDVRAEKSLVGKVNMEELEVFSSCYDILAEDWPTIGDRPADVYIITPFRDVSAKLNQILPSDAPGKMEAGTIHTFQGKEADIVFIVLGTKPGQAGARSRAWAARTPNMLNVALTRARSRVYVIGNAEDWSQHRNFDVLHETMAEAGQIIGITRTDVDGVKAALGIKVEDPQPG